jgi:hypothetical protein
VSKPPPGNGPIKPSMPTLHISFASPTTGAIFIGGSQPDAIAVNGNAFLTCDDPGGDCLPGRVQSVLVQIGDARPQRATLTLSPTGDAGSWSFTGSPLPGTLNETPITAILEARVGRQVITEKMSVTVTLVVAISVRQLLGRRGIGLRRGIAESLPWLTRPTSLRQLAADPAAFPVLEHRVMFFPDVHGFAFDNTWFFDDVEKSKIQEVCAAALATVFTVLAPVVIPVVAPLQGFVDALGALFGIPPGVGEVVEGKLAVDKIKNIIDTRLMSSYGLCGGMASSALDYFLTGRPIPRRYTSPPTRPEGSVLRDYIWARLLDGMEAGVASSTVEWIVILKLGLWGGRRSFCVAPEANGPLCGHISMLIAHGRLC